MISQDRQVRVDYERRRMAYHDAISLRRDSWLEGVEEGTLQGKRQGLDEGKRTGVIETLIEGLNSQGLVLSAAQLERINTEPDLARLKRWAARAALAASVEGLLDS